MKCPDSIARLTISDNEQNIPWRMVIARSLVDTESICGDVVECGCYFGETSLMIRQVLEELCSAKEFHVYDSFMGLPERTPEDGPVAKPMFASGGLRSDISGFLNYLSGHEPPIIHDGWFNDTLPDGLPDKISFAFLDGDLYESINTCLDCVYPRLSMGGIMYVHDYDYYAFPGVKKAVDPFVAAHPDLSLSVEAACALICKEEIMDSAVCGKCDAPIYIEHPASCIICGDTVCLDCIVSCSECNTPFCHDCAEELIDPPEQWVCQHCLGEDSEEN